MNVDILRLTEEIIGRAVGERDAILLQKEATFLLNCYVIAMSEAFSQIEYVKPTKVQFRMSPDFIFGDNYVSSLKKLLASTERIQQQQLDVIEAKLLLDSWFYESTEVGSLQYVYNESELVNISEAADYFGVSRTTLYKYIDRGLETVGEKHNQKIPLFMLDAWKKPEVSFRMQWIAQLKRAREQTLEQRLDDINKQIAEFEKKFGGSFYLLFSNTTEQETDAHPEAVDLHDWRELEKEKQEELLSRLKGER